PTIGPTTKPTKRSIAVHSPPPTTWQKTSPQRSSRAIATTTPISASATNGSPRTRMTWTRGRSPSTRPAVPASAAAVIDERSYETRRREDNGAASGSRGVSVSASAAATAGGDRDGLRLGLRLGGRDGRGIRDRLRCGDRLRDGRRLLDGRGGEGHRRLGHGLLGRHRLLG